METIIDDGKPTNETIPPFIEANNGNTKVYFDEDWEVGIGGGLWSNGLNLSKFFIDYPDLLKKNFQQVLSAKRHYRKGTNEKSNERIRAIELGSGNGLLGACLAAVVGDLLDSLYITDLSDHLELMKQTVLANPHILKLSNEKNEENNCDSERAKTSIKCHVAEHAWGEFESSGPLSEKFDFIFGSDVAYRDYLHDPLISSLLHFSGEHTISIIGVTMTDTKPIFFQKLREAGFRYDKIPDYLMSQEFRGTTFGLFVIQKNTSLS